jgi:hypothetical protein
VPADRQTRPPQAPVELLPADARRGRHDQLLPDQLDEAHGLAPVPGPRVPRGHDRPHGEPPEVDRVEVRGRRRRRHDEVRPLEQRVLDLQVADLPGGDGGVVRAERGDERDEQPACRDRGRAAHERRDVAGAQVTGRPLGEFGLGEQPARDLAHRHPAGRGHQPAAVAFEQAQREVALELVDLPAQRRLGDVERGGRGGERARVEHGHEVGQAPQVKHDYRNPL